MGLKKSDTMTRHHPQYQSITSPLSSREKGDWGFKRPFPLKSTMATSTPLIRVKGVDTIENITDFASAADHTMSLEKFEELRIAMTMPKSAKHGGRPNHGLKSVFEEQTDVTDLKKGKSSEVKDRWRFRGPWLARMTNGDFGEYLAERVRPRRAEFRKMLRENLAEEITTRQNNAAMESGTAPPPKVEPHHVTDTQLTEYLRSLRNDRVTLYAIISKFLDLAPLGKPAGFLQMIWSKGEKSVEESPYGESGPPPSHPSAGIGYLRTNSFMENHPVYGPQSKKTPALARMVYPRANAAPAKLGVGGFVATAPSGENTFNVRYSRGRIAGSKTMTSGITHLDTTTHGGAKAFIEPETATVDPSGRVVVRVLETSHEAQLIARESKGQSQIYKEPEVSGGVEELSAKQESEALAHARMRRVADEMMQETSAKAQVEEQDVVSSSQAYGLDIPKDGQK